MPQITTKGDIDLIPAIHTKDPENNGIPKGWKVGINLSAYQGNKELDNEAVQEAGLAHKTILRWKREDGSTYAEYVGKGSSGEVFDEDSDHAGYAIPNPGYTLDGMGISAIEHSNGFRGVTKMREEGYFTAEGFIDGMPVRFPGGNTIRVGKAKPRVKDHQ